MVMVSKANHLSPEASTFEGDKVRHSFVNSLAPLGMTN